MQITFLMTEGMMRTTDQGATQLHPLVSSQSGDMLSYFLHCLQDHGVQMTDDQRMSALSLQTAFIQSFAKATDSHRLHTLVIYGIQNNNV
jgi:hypothetical protein